MSSAVETSLILRAISQRFLGPSRLDAERPACYQLGDAPQGHDLCCSRRGAFFGDRSIASSSVHRDQHAEPEGVSARVLCEQGLLRNVPSADWTTGSTAREIESRSTKFCGTASNDHPSADPFYHARIENCFSCRARRAFSAAALTALHVSHLIQGR